MVKHEFHTIVFTITPERATALHQTVKQQLLAVGDIPINLLVYMALNQLTINQTISAQLTKNIEQLCSEHLANYNYEQHLQVIATCEYIAALLYNDYCQAMVSAHLPMPAKLLSVDYNNTAVAMMFETLDDQSCTWSYTTLPL